MPTLSGNQGYLGVATQVDKNTQNLTDADVTWFEVYEAPYGVGDDTRNRRPVIGDNPFTRGAYKTGTSTQSSFSMEVTPISIGKLLLLAMGETTKTGIAYPVSHAFNMAAADPYAIDYFTLLRDVGNNIKEYSAGNKIAEISLAFVAGDALTCQVSSPGLRPGEIPDGTVLTPSYDTGTVLTVQDDNAHADVTINGTTYTSGGTGTAVDILAAKVQLVNTFPDVRKRRGIGSKFPIDLTVVARAAVVELTLEISDRALYQEIYYTGGVWNDVPAMGSFAIAASNTDAEPAILTVEAANVNFSGMLIANSPQEVVTARLSGTVLRDTIADTLKFTLVNSQTTAYV